MALAWRWVGTVGLTALIGCGSDSGGQGQNLSPVSGGDGDGGSQADASAPAVVDSGSNGPSVDAAAQADAGVDAGAQSSGPHCAEGEMACGNECIPAIQPTLEELQRHIFAGSCGLAASCHMPPSPKEGLDLSTLDATFSQVNKPSAQMPSAKLFDTASPADSYILRKMRGMNIAAMSTTGTSSLQMPWNLPPLCAEKIDLIEAWVKAGAKR